jgi:hypothetical protein
MNQRDGWFDDPYGKHDGRYFSQGQPTNRVRDGNRFFFEEPPTEPAPDDAELALASKGADGTGTGTDEDLLVGPEAAWYPDPTGPGQMRFWDGAQWTEQVMPAPVPVAVPVGEDPVPVPVPVPIPAPLGASAPSSTAVEETRTEGAKMKPGVVGAKDGAAMPRAEDLVDDTPPTPAPSSAAPRTPVAATPPAGRGAHYVLAPGLDRSGQTEADAVSIVTGEVPAEYSRISVECEDGEVVEATVLNPSPVGGATLFVALVRHHVRRIVATKEGGVYGVFLDVDQLERDDVDQASGAATNRGR